jgi:hypothetical protein
MMGEELGEDIKDYFAGGAREARRREAQFRDMLRDEIKRLETYRYASEGMYDKLFDQDGMPRVSYEEMYNVLEEAYDTYFAAGGEGGTDEAITQASILHQLKQYGGFSEEPTQMPNPQGVGTTDLDVGTYVPLPQELQALQNQIVQDGGSFAGALARDGVLIPDAESATVPIPMAGLALWGEATQIYDPATGYRWSPTEWTALNDPNHPEHTALLLDYFNNKQAGMIAPNVKEIISKDVFAQQVDQARRSTIPGFDPRDWNEMSESQRQEAIRLSQTEDYAPQIPVEDLAIPALVPTQPWEVPRNRYRQGDGFSDWMSFSTSKRTATLSYMHDQGLIPTPAYEEMVDNSSSSVINLMAMEIYDAATQMAGVTGYDVNHIIGVMGDRKRQNDAIAAAQSRGYGRSAPRYSVPASLREIPDYEALAQESKEIFGNRLGREMEDWELAIVSDELQRAYKMQNKEKIEAHRAAWEDAVSGGTVDVENIEVTNPAYEVDYYLEEKYEAELDRQDRVQERQLNNALLLDSLVTGKKMI